MLIKFISLICRDGLSEEKERTNLIKDISIREKMHICYECLQKTLSNSIINSIFSTALVTEARDDRTAISFSFSRPI